jgi:hypothetical protein
MASPTRPSATTALEISGAVGAELEFPNRFPLMASPAPTCCSPIIAAMTHVKVAPSKERKVAISLAESGRPAASKHADGQEPVLDIIHTSDAC